MRLQKQSRKRYAIKSLQKQSCKTYDVFNIIGETGSNEGVMLLQIDLGNVDTSNVEKDTAYAKK